MYPYLSTMINICLLFIINFVDVSSNLMLSEYGKYVRDLKKINEFFSVSFKEQCNAPLGMESGLITDDDLTASSTHDFSSVGPHMAR